MSLIPHISDLLLFLIGVVVVYIIYRYCPDDTKILIQKIIINYGFYIGAFIFWLYFRKKWGIIADFPQEWPGSMYRVTFYVGFVIIIYFAFKSWLYEFRYNTNQFIGDNIHGSVARTHRCGDWIVEFLGTSGLSDEHWCIPWPWTKRISVYHKSTRLKLGNQRVSIAHFEKVDLFDMPVEIADFLEKDTFAKLCLDELWLGVFSNELLASDPEINEILQKFKKINARSNEDSAMLKGKLTKTKGFVSDTIATADKLRGKDWRGSRRPSQQEE